MSPDYALMHCEAETIGRLHLGNALELPFPDNSFKAAISLNTIHNLDRAGCLQALKEIQRVSGGRAFVQVDSYRTPEQKAIFEDWVLTARFHDYPRRLDRAIPRGRLYRRLFLDDHRVTEADMDSFMSINAKTSTQRPPGRAASATAGASSTSRSRSRRCISAAPSPAPRSSTCIYNGLMRQPGGPRPTPS